MRPPLLCQRCGAMIEKCNCPMPTAAEIERQNREYRAKMGATTAHELARLLLALPNAPVVFVKPAGGPYTHEYHLQSNPWHALSQVRIQITDSDGEAACSKPSTTG